MRNDAALTKHYEEAGYSTVTGRYFEQPRESQKKIIEDLALCAPKKEKLRFLDLGCGPGSLLPHVRTAFPSWELHGLDISEKFLEFASATKALSEVTFHKEDLLDPVLYTRHEPFDVIVAHAVLYNFSPADVHIVLTNVARMLNPGGVFIAFEWMQRMDGELTITFRPDEENRDLAYHVHRQSTFKEVLKPFNIALQTCVPFRIPIDLPDRGGRSTHTKLGENGDRLQFWGDIYQPWHFLVAQKSGDAPPDPHASWKPEPDEDEWS